MPRLRVSDQASSDVGSIAAYIATERPAVARRVGAKLYRTFNVVARRPFVGTIRDDIRPGLRVMTPGPPASRYLVFFQYDAANGIVEITAVIDGSRDWESMLDAPEA